MKTSFKISKSMLVFVLGFGLASCNLSCATYQGPLTIDRNVLESNRVALEEGDADLKLALTLLSEQADSVLQVPNRSVTDKSTVPPSGDKRDYLSMGQYWWPDPSKSDGLPYIRKDGKTNPEFYKITDNTYIRQMSTNVRTLALVYFYTKDEKYAEKAISQIETWFLDPKTKMNPNLNYAQHIPGLNDGRSEGLIDTRVLVDVLNSISMLETSAKWSLQLNDGLKDWFTQYLRWLQTSKIGIGGSKLVNNIGSAYYVQVVAFAIYTGNTLLARNIIETKLPKLIDHQFDDEGKQPEELSRTNAWGYSIANLNYWFRLAQLAENINIDLWNYKTPSNKSIKQAYDWLSQYANKEKKWTYSQLNKVDFEETFASMRIRGERKFSSESSSSLRRRISMTSSDRGSLSGSRSSNIGERQKRAFVIKNPDIVLTEGI